MDALNRWFLTATDSPAGSILMMLFVFLLRVGLDSAQRKRAERIAHKKRKAA